MAQIFSKNRIIVLLLLSNFTLALALVNPGLHDRLSGWHFGKKSPPAPPLSRLARIEAPGVDKSGQIQACYQSLLARNPSVDEGSVVMHWMLDGAGKIVDLKLIHSDIEDRTFTDCLTDSVRAARFPASATRAGVLISHKFNFHRKDPSQITY